MKRYSSKKQCSKRRTLARSLSGPHGLFLHWTASIRCGREMEQERKEDAQHPKAIFHEAVSMGGVDLMDKCVAMYPNRGRTKQWYIRVFFHFLDTTNVNAWHLYRMSGWEQKDPLHFKASTVCAFINAGSSRHVQDSTTPPPMKRRAVSKAHPEIRFGPGNYWPQLTKAKNADRCHDSACT